MPEGDTVWRTARRLHHALSGRDLTISDLRVPRWAHVDLTGQRVEETVSRGKHLLTRLPAVTLHTHLKMEGSWHILRPGGRWRAPAHQARVVLGNDTWHAVGFRLGAVDVVGRDDEARVVGHLGPDLLGPDWSADEAVRHLTADPAATIGDALLDQRNLAGIGTVYRAEVLHVCGISPFAEVGEVADLATVVERARGLLRANLEEPRQITTGSRRRGEEHWVYGRAGRPCRRCGTTIEVAQSGPPTRQRVVFWCPRCQPRP